MGWCSGTDIFDEIVGVVLPMNSLPILDKKTLIKSLIEILWSHDWDCEYDSEYTQDNFVRLCFEELDFHFTD